MRVPLPQIKQGRVLADWVTASLREAILHGYFEPGEKLDQDCIAEELEVSRTPVREAIRRLESEGFVEVRPHYGAFITRRGARYGSNAALMSVAFVSILIGLNYLAQRGLSSSRNISIH